MRLILKAFQARNFYTVTFLDSDICSTTSAAMDTCQKTLYRPLAPETQEMRLVRIEPGFFASEIKCSLHHTSLNSITSFEAVSYVWGDPLNTLPIFIQDERFTVTKNLESALRHLRFLDQPRIFWIDAICINQQNIEERGQQVMMMGEIYKAAERVVVWLGDEGEDSAIAFEYISLKVEFLGRAKIFRSHLEEIKIASQRIIEQRSLLQSEDPKTPEELQRWGVRWDETSAKLRALVDEINTEKAQAAQNAFIPATQSSKSKLSPEQAGFLREAVRKDRIELLNDQMPSDDGNPSEELEQAMFNRAIIALLDIWDRSWWRRVWVVQETAVAQAVVLMCGSLSATWADLRSIPPSHISDRIIESDAASVVNMLNMRDETSITKRKETGLLYLLSQFRYCNATDPRDKVYALLGLAVDHDAFKIPIDYNIATEDLYKQVVRSFIEQDGNLDILSHILSIESPKSWDNVHNILSNLPTWAPDWSGKPVCNAFSHKSKATQPLYSASLESRAILQPSSSPDELTVTGFIFDAIESLNEIILDIFEQIDQAAEVDNTGYFYRSLQHLTTIQQCEAQALAVTEHDSPYPLNILEAFWRTLIADTTGGTRATPATGTQFRVWSGREVAPHREYEYAKDYVTALQAATTCRRFGFSCKKYMVLVPAEAQAGDMICILLGGQMPFVLRERDGGFGFVGQCYVHGIMDGEAMMEQRKVKHKMQDFALR